MEACDTACRAPALSVCRRGCDSAERRETDFICGSAGKVFANILDGDDQINSVKILVCLSGSNLLENMKILAFKANAPAIRDVMI